MRNPLESAKKYYVNGREYEQHPMSFFDMLEFPEIFADLARESLGDPDKKISPGDVIRALKGRLKSFFASRLNIGTEELRDIPAHTGMEIIADFVEMNLNENFTKALSRAVPSLKEMFSALHSFYGSTDTADRTSGATH